MRGGRCSEKNSVVEKRNSDVWSSESEDLRIGQRRSGRIRRPPTRFRVSVMQRLETGFGTASNGPSGPSGPCLPLSGHQQRPSGRVNASAGEPSGPSGPCLPPSGQQQRPFGRVNVSADGPSGPSGPCLPPPVISSDHPVA